jgi:hypothetical protein
VKMEKHTTNYFNTFILVADDCPSSVGEIPPQKNDTKSIANIQYDLILKHPYRYTSDEIIFLTHAYRLDLIEDEYDKARTELFSKGQACLRSSPLTKRYGWGIHFNDEGKVAMFGFESLAYQKFLTNPNVKRIKAMRSSKAGK